MEIKSPEIEILLNSKPNESNTNTLKKQTINAFGLFLFQTSTVVLLIRYSQIKDNNKAYANTSIIVLAEIGQIFIAFIYCLYDYV